MNKPRDRTIRVNELRLHYLDWGGDEDKTILLLHGFMGHARVWDDLAAELSTRYRVLALNQRGHGDSEWSQVTSYGMDSHFADLSVFIESLEVKKIILLGHSMGGRNALFYAACAPEKVERLILVDTRLGNNPDASKALRRQMASLPLKAKTIAEPAEALRNLYPYLSIDVCIDIAKHGYSMSKDGRFIPKYDTRMGRQIERSDYVTEELYDMIKNVECPTLIIRGKESPFLSLKEAQRICAAFPEVTFKEIAGATHMPAQENPDDFKKAVFDFLDEK
jgi:pimeloyl-ACP methyl ester carboxylesterase